MRHPGLMAGVLAGLLSGCLPTLEDECSKPGDCDPGQACRAGLCVAASADPPDGEAPGAGGNRPGGGPDQGAEPHIDAAITDAAPDAAPPACSDDETLCDGRDDDCDGQTDEGLQVGTLCSIGQGACEAQGALGCGVGGAVVCSAAQVAPADENCDGRDNDCDGRTDEDIRQPCYTGPPGTAEVGACRPGRTECTDGTIGRCLEQVLPEDEPAVCDGVDQDCDGAVDETVVGQPCYPGDDDWLAAPETACRAGTQACVDGEASCAGARLPDDADGCNGVNDDCDGAVDEDCTCVDGEPCAGGEGVCAPGTQFCNGPVLIRCEGRQVAEAETCNGADDDCDGTTDEDADATCEGDAIGICRPGVRRCVDGAPGEACTGRVGAAATEACDGRDDDCDGATDELFPDLGEACSVGVGICRRAGVRACAPDGTVGCNVQAGMAGTETCNGQDDDCDGVTDEDADVPCWPDPNATAAPCRQGVRACNGGMLAQTCTGGQAPVAEICGNGVDEDCDGAADDGCVCTEGDRRACGEGDNVCRPGQQTCRANAWSACQGIVYGVPEICDGMDNDCDGQTDEDVAAESCYDGPDGTQNMGTCRAGTRRCTNGQRGPCLGQTRPLDEDLCNGDDDDCDGIVDEDGVGEANEACDTGGAGLCARGERICDGGSVICQATHEAAADDVCDGQDQDCDGFADEAVEREFGPTTLSRATTAAGVDADWTPDNQRLAVIFVEAIAAAAPSIKLLDGGGVARGQRSVDGVPAGQSANRVAIVGVELPDGLIDGVLELIFGDAEPDLAAAFGTGSAIGINFLSSTDANLRAPAQVVATGDVSGLDLAFGGGRAVVSYAEHGRPDDLVLMRRMGPSADSTEPAVTLHMASGRVDATAIAAGTGDRAGTYGVAWRVTAAGAGTAVFFGAFDSMGQPVVAPARISLPAAAVSAPSVTWDERRFVVAYAQGNPQRPVLTYVHPGNGETETFTDVDGAGAGGAATEAPIIAAAVGGISRVVWVRSANRAVHLRTFRRDGTPRAAPTRVLLSGALQAPIAVAPLGGDGEAVAWVRLVPNADQEVERHAEVTFGQLLCPAP